MPDTDKAAAEAEEQLVAFSLADELYAVEIARINVIIRSQPVTKVPGTPPAVSGVINLRGEIVPIIDLRQHFEMQHAEPTRSSRIVVVESNGQSVGLLVDGVTETLQLPKADIQPPPRTGGPSAASHIRGLGKSGGNLLILLDVDRLLEDARGQAAA